MANVNIGDLPVAAEMFANTRVETQNPVTGVNEQTELQFLASMSATLKVKNTTGAEIPGKTAVGFVAYDDATSTIEIDLASSIGRHRALGITMTVLADQAIGYIVRIGMMRLGIDLTGLTVDHLIWLGDAGALTTDPPDSGELQIIGRVVTPQPNGEVWIDPTNDPELLGSLFDWRSGELYHVDATVVFEQSTWRCIVTHDATDFPSDLNGGAWELLSSGGLTGPQASRPTALITGLCYYNTDRNRPEYWDGTRWRTADGKNA